MPRRGDHGDVTQELERIFGRSAGAAPRLPDPVHPDQSVCRSLVPVVKRTGRGRWVTAGAPLVAVGAIGYFLVQAQLPSAPPPVRPAATVAAVPAPAPAPAPEVHAAVPPPVAYSVSADLAENAPAPVPLPSATVTATERAPAKPRARPAPSPSWLATGDISSNCRPGSDQDACIYRDVRDADRRLVQVYREAVRAGVPRETLVRATRVWNRALDLSLDDPDETIRRYDRLADDLHAATQAARRNEVAGLGR